MARGKKQNPIDDISKTVGGWLGGAARSLNVLATGDKNPSMNPTTRKGIRAVQGGLNVASGGGVTAIQQGPDAVVRYANTQIALYGLGEVAGEVIPAAVSRAAKTRAGQAITNKALDVAFQAQMLKPMTTRQSIRAQRPLLDKVIEARGEIARLQDELSYAKQATKAPDYDYMDLYEAYNPTSLQTRNTIEQIGENAISKGRKNQMLMDAASRAYRNIDEDLNQEEIRFTKRFFREKGKSTRRVMEARRSYLNSLPPAQRAAFLEREATQRQSRLQRLLDISNARRNMPENYIDPKDFFK